MKESLREVISGMINEYQTRWIHLVELKHEFAASYDYHNASDTKIRISETEKQIRDLEKLLNH